VASKEKTERLRAFSNFICFHIHSAQQFGPLLSFHSTLILANIEKFIFIGVMVSELRCII
jgi:hypothetical protein